MKRLVTLCAVGSLTVAALSACSDSSSDSAASPAASPAQTSAAPSPTQTTASPSPATASPTTDLCSEESILAAIPEGSEMVRYDCADVSGTQWAAAEVDPGPTVFFLQAAGDTWQVSTSDEICGTASAGLPPKLLDYCS